MSDALAADQPVWILHKPDKSALFKDMHWTTLIH